MDQQHVDMLRRIIADPGAHCPVCKAPRYISGRGEFEVTIHCASPEARYWESPPGSLEEKIARRHWDLSRKEIFLITGDAVYAGDPSVL